MPSTVSVSVGCLDDIRGETDMLAEQCAEVGAFDGEPLSVDWSQYDAMERAGLLVVLVVRDGDELVGYSVSTLARHPHHNIVVMFNNAICVKPGRRKSRIASDLIDAVESTAKEAGATFVIWSSPDGSSLGPVVLKRGYQPIETQYMKAI